MAIDPSIALGVRPIEIANPVAQYGQIAQIQNAQNQNALAQYQLGAAQRAEQTANTQNELYAKHFNPATGGLDVNALVGEAAQRGQGGIIPGILKSENERQKAAADLTKSKIESAASKQKLLSQALRDISSRPSDANIMAHTEDIQASDLFTPAEKQKALATQQTLLAMPFEERIKFLSSQGATAGEMKPHVVTENLGATSRVSAIPAFGGAPTTVSQSPIAMSAAQIEQNKVAQRNADIAAGRLAVEQKRLAQDATGVVYQEDANGNIVALPSKLKAGEVPTGRMAVAPGGGFQPMTAKPSESVGKEQMSINQQKSIVQGALKAITETPDAFGYTTGMMPESLRGRMASPEENTNRSYLFNVVSGVIKERAGTAQSAAEAQTLARFLPTETDNADIIKSKLEGFDKYLTDKEKGTTKKRSNVPANPVANPAANPYSSMSNDELLKELRGK
jgi:hypothetical protein